MGLMNKQTAKPENKQEDKVFSNPVEILMLIMVIGLGILFLFTIASVMLSFFR
jgi:hypothetical protein